MFIGRSGETIFSCVYGLTVDTSISVECGQYHKMQQGSLGQKKWDELTGGGKLSEILTECCLSLFSKFTETVGLSAVLHKTVLHCDC